MKRIAISVLSMLLLGGTAGAQVVGEVLPAWTPGTLDIHQISTGRGNCAFFVLPDAYIAFSNYLHEFVKNPER